VAVDGSSQRHPPSGSLPLISLMVVNMNLTFLLDCTFTEISADHQV
jgi:hypothetical protein